MPEIALEPLVDALAPVLELVAMIALSAVGLLAERAGVAHLQTGVDPVTIWFFAIGVVPLYAGVYLIGYRTLLPRLRGAVTGA